MCACTQSLCQYKASLIMEVSFVILLLYVFSNGELNVYCQYNLFIVLFLAFVCYYFNKVSKYSVTKSNSQECNELKAHTIECVGGRRISKLCV